MKALSNKLFQVFICLLFISFLINDQAEAQRTGDDVGGIYNERYRPQFHFTSKTNWLNDPNGLTYYDGEYHLFFQHNPEGTNWGYMTWGHAISTDLVHWEQQEHKLWPDSLGTIFSGSAVVDHNNTAGFQTGDEKTIVLIYTYAGNQVEPGKDFTQAIAYSNDRGRTFTKYHGNPVLPNQAGGHDRDPKVFWHESTEKWVMILYENPDREGHHFAIYTSPNLKDWAQTQIIEDEFFEVPDLFELAIDGDPNNTKWVMMDVFGDYLLGSFDGERFERISGRHKSDYGNNYFATHTWSNVPDDRTIQIAWMRHGEFSNMPFNQQLTFPNELSLRTTPDGIRMFRNPIQEIESLHDETHTFSDTELVQRENLLDGIEGDVFEVNIEFELEEASVVGLGIGGSYPGHHASVEYYSSDKTVRTRVGHRFSTAPLEPVEGKVKLQILIDRTSIEVFGNDGRITMTNHYNRPNNHRNIKLNLYAREGNAHINSLKVHKLNSAWEYERNKMKE